MIDAIEIERVRRIHHWLDQWSAEPVSGVYRTPCGIRFDATEVEAWPTLKAEMVAVVRAYAISRKPLAFVTSKGDVDYFPNATGRVALLQQTWNDDYKSAERGLYMTRELLPESATESLACPNGCGKDPFGKCRACGGVPPVEAQPAAKVDPPAKLNPELTRAQRVLHRHEPDPYLNNREQVITYEQHKADNASGRRARLIAALAQELRRPAPVRFPVPGRNFELKGGRYE
jgi:hypothetical protein